MRFELLDPKSDDVFKRQVADAPELLTSLINAVRRDRPPVRSIRVRHPLILPSEIEAPAIVLDLLATDAGGRRFDVEIRAHRHGEGPVRPEPRLVPMVMMQLATAAEPRFPPAAVGIHPLDFDYLDDSDRASACFGLRSGQDTSVRLDDGMELNVVELRKAASRGDSLGLRAAWANFFEHWNDGAAMTRIEHPAIRAALERPAELSCDEHECRRAELRELAVRSAGPARAMPDAPGYRVDIRHAAVRSCVHSSHARGRWHA